MEKLKSQSYLSLSWLAPDGTSRVENLFIEAIKYSSTCFFFPSQGKAQAFYKPSTQRQSCSPGYEKTYRRKKAPSVTPGTQSFLYPPPHSKIGKSCSRLSRPHLSCSSLYVSIFFIPSLSHTRPPQAPLLPFCSESGNSSVPVQLPG